VVAVLGTNIQKVQCLTCGSEHKFHPQKEDGPKVKSVRVKESAKGHSRAKEGKDSASKIAAKAESEWTTFMSELDPDSVPHSYDTSASYSKADYINHPVFGIGRVLHVLGVEKIEVIFKEGRKILIFNRSKP
jgi:hypothetical protein